MNWIEVSITTAHDGIQAVCGLLHQLGIEGLMIDDPAGLANYKGKKKDWDYIDTILLERSDLPSVKLWIRDDVDAPEMLIQIRQVMEDLKNKNIIDTGSLEVILNNVKETDWADNWKKYFKPVRIGEKFVICPSWETWDAEPDDIVIDMDPGMAFGTGTHQTTKLCLEMLDKYVVKGQTMLDIGCGTGILSIGGSKLGIDVVTAVDIDRKAVDATLKNIKGNDITSDRINVIHGDMLKKVKGRYDIVIANIIADAIIFLSEAITNYLNDSSIFIASGIILDRLDDVFAALKSHGFELIEYRTDGEWAVVVSKIKSLV